MAMQSTSQIDDKLAELSVGYRLLRVEIFNWGTFDKQIWILKPQGQTALLTGANGSGKSTIVDAVLTLLVPSQGRNYNQAAGSVRKQERSEKSYVQGAYGQFRDDMNQSTTRYLREKNTYSVLLAVFANPLNDKILTLAQVFWFQGSNFNKFHVVAERELSIAEDFLIQADMKQLKQDLRKASHVTVYDQFNQYATHLNKRFHLRSSKALDLFNQIVAIKEIGALNEFVRRHMLEAIDMQPHIDDLRANYDNLSRAYQAIQKAQTQRDLLLPLLEEADRYTQQYDRIAETEQRIEVLPHFFNTHKITLYQAALEDTRAKLTHHEQAVNQLTDDLAHLRQQEKDLDFTIRTDAVGQQLNDLKRQITETERWLTQKREQFAKYQVLTEQLELAPVTNLVEFTANQAEARLYLSDADAYLAELEARQYLLLNDIQEMQKDYDELYQEIEELRQRPSHIPHRELAIRADLAQSLGVPEEELPYIGELLKVREEAWEWEPALERLLHGFALQMLVPDKYYRKVSEYVDATNLRGRLVYQRLQTFDSNTSTAQLSANSVYHKLQIKPDTLFREWLVSQLVRRYDYVCCATLNEFQHEERAITQQAQIKHGRNHHEKDDRFALGDRRKYVLGWDNREKLNALEETLQDKKEDLTIWQVNLQAVQKDMQVGREQRDIVRDLLNFTNWLDLDWQTEQTRLNALRVQQTELLQASNQLQLLRQQLQDVQTQIKQIDGDVSRQQQVIGTYQNDVKRYQKEVRKCEVALDGIQHDAYRPYFADIEAELEESLTLENIDDIEKRRLDFYYRSKSRLQGTLNNQSEAIIKHMSNFKNKYPAETDEVDASIEAIGWYADKSQQIEQDDLPRYRGRFRELMQHNITQSVTIFKATLDEQKALIRQSIDQLNITLKSIPYDEATYIQLICENNPDREIQQFQVQLRECYPNVGRDGDEAHETAFQNIHELIELFMNESRWTQKVTDVRNWLEFSAQELWRDDDSLKEHYDSSSGKSGGQKAKLAYTILASAIAYQYQLDDPQYHDQTFRFVVVDEVFSKSDEQNSRFAMDLFRRLGLQVLVVTPSDKIHVVEPYIGTCHFVWNNTEGNYSQVCDMTLAEIHEQRLRYQDNHVS